MKKTLIKNGGGQLASIVNTQPQYGKMVYLYMDGRECFHDSLEQPFEVKFPMPDDDNNHSVFNSMDKPYKVFFEKLEMETNGDVTVIYQ